MYAGLIAATSFNISVGILLGPGAFFDYSVAQACSWFLILKFSNITGLIISYTSVTFYITTVSVSQLVSDGWCLGKRWAAIVYTSSIDNRGFAKKPMIGETH